MAVRSEGEQGDRPRDGAPTSGSSWSARLPRRAGNADGCHAPDGRSPGGARAKQPGHHRGLSAGHGITGVTRDRGRASRVLGTIARQTRGTGGPRALARTGGFPPSASRRRDTNGGSRPGIAPPAPRAVVRAGGLAVVVEPRTEGLGAQPKPARWGTKAHGTHGRAGATGPNGCWRER
jgi:hypothetical protein